ncbi:hypothetical protein PPL_08802 [Heterostelium album PN500]|uniref:Uncharacterized protein n=1 Tax=Heterostelium pallidum (strain ATCC 26659 / Pp 5 / PN500) TaxID=670386 RepID=D3BJS2_HETP5|nr:hypothetical protein PPL_08802 [Heterostelium album PN500]EFA78152.1 hypothetical protein PPL_08802 [Heterostelium album PN500]|eukprot:XP_020430278.1 hypothetical protein PPL_08802 [Heterostelium album PN500]
MDERDEPEFSELGDVGIEVEVVDVLLDETGRTARWQCRTETLLGVQHDLKVHLDVRILCVGTRVLAVDDANQQLPKHNAYTVDVGFRCIGRAGAVGNLGRAVRECSTNLGECL